MKKITIVLMLLVLSDAATASVRHGEGVSSKNETSGPGDTLRTEVLDGALVRAVVASPSAPFAVTNLGLRKLESFSGSCKELPHLLSTAPGVLAWSENGLGSGTTYMRIRGAGDSRINVSIDGVPLNSPEDQCVFWANLNSYSAVLGGIQLQRGIGTSAHGDGAFGGSVALKTKAPSYLPSAEFSASLGSYNSSNTGLSLSSGLLGGHWAFDAAFHTTGTDGYVHGTAGRSGSWFGSIAWTGRDIAIRYRNIGNFEHTGQAWNGVVAGNDDLSLMDGTYGMHTGIHTYADLYRAGLGRYNILYESLDTDSYALTRFRYADGRLRGRTTDNFTQDHNILSAVWTPSPRLTSTVSLHYTHGHGYYDEFKSSCKLSKFGFASFIDDKEEEVKRCDFVREKGLGQDTGGAVWSLAWDLDGGELLAGASVQFFKGSHYGDLTYVSSSSVIKQYPVLQGLDDPYGLDSYRYYTSSARKDEGSAYVKFSHMLGEGFSAFIDLQLRNVRHIIDGVNDKFIENPDGTYSNQPLDFDISHIFFNPKAGISWNRGAHSAYASVARGGREPERNNYTDNGSYPVPRAEHMNDFELGYKYSSHRFFTSINLYYMDYTDQLVQTGAVSDIGENLTTNIKDSFRTGVEISAGADAAQWLSLEANAAFSRNRILDFDEVVEDWDSGFRTIHYSSSTLAYSPSVILNGAASFKFGAFETILRTQHAGRQYLDNTQNLDRSLPAYTVTSCGFKYLFTPQTLVKEIEIDIDFNNIFNTHYASSGWVYSAICSSCGHDESNRYYQIGFIPSAGLTALAHLKIKF